MNVISIILIQEVNILPSPTSLLMSYIIVFIEIPDLSASLSWAFYILDMQRLIFNIWFMSVLIKQWVWLALNITILNFPIFLMLASHLSFTTNPWKWYMIYSTFFSSSKPSLEQQYSSLLTILSLFLFISCFLT